MNRTPTPPTEYEDGAFVSLDGSTAPTTPDGSVTFSPSLRALRPNGDVEDILPTGNVEAAMRQVPVQRICCVGAGYVGKSASESASNRHGSDMMAGGPTAAIMAFQNPHITVTVVDKDATRISRWNSRHLPIYEPGLRDIVRIARDGSREFTISSEAQCPHDSATSPDGTADCPEYHGEGCLVEVPARKPNLIFSTDVAGAISEADMVLIAVNTPTKTRGRGAGSATDMSSFEAVTSVVAQHAKPNAILVEKSTVPCGTSELVNKIVGSSSTEDTPRCADNVE
jgi:UDPglucose 6-dehydrogenase